MNESVSNPLVSPIPIRFEYDENHRALRIIWSDDKIQLIAYATLRRHCPCAVCSGEWNVPGRFDANSALASGEDELADISLVGAYGINAVWQDGHNTGIYTFEKLRSLDG